MYPKLNKKLEWAGKPYFSHHIPLRGSKTFITYPQITFLQPNEFGIILLRIYGWCTNSLPGPKSSIYREVSQGPRCSHTLHVCLQRDMMTSDDTIEFREKFSRMRVLWIRTSNSSHRPGGELATLNIRMIWVKLDSAHQSAWPHCAKTTLWAKQMRRKQSSKHLPSHFFLQLALFLPHTLQGLFSDISHENFT